MIPVNEPLLKNQELANVIDCVQSGWISSSGKYIEQFEAAWAKECGVDFGVAVSNGSVALDIAIEALNLNVGDEIILPTFTIISCVSAVLRSGAVPVLIDSEPETWGMDVSQVAAKITSKTRAIMAVHIYGHPVDMDPLLELADRHNLVIIEDAAEVHGAEYLSQREQHSGVWRRCGGIGHLATFSFFANKLITTGEGGMIVTNDRQLAEKLRGLRNLCFRTPRRFYHTELGHNFRMTNMQAALGVPQVSRLDEIVLRKREIAARYSSRLKKIKLLQLPIEKVWAKNVYWVYGIVLDDKVEFDAKEFSRRLAADGVETRPFFLGMHSQPVFHDRDLFCNASDKYPVADRIAERGLYVPSGLAITDMQIDHVCDAIERIFNA